MKKERFDSIIRENLAARGADNVFGYVVPGTGRTYDAYYTEAAFQSFQDEMERDYPAAFRQYGEGKGSEMKEHAGPYGDLPPKMASVASSSRFCYLALRDGGAALGGGSHVKFEHGCPIKGVAGTAPQLDAYMAEGNIFVEVKCHEIFDAHRVVMKEKYWEHIYGPDNAFGFPAAEKPAGEEFQVPLSAFGVQGTSSMFDIKQLLCHLLGIASQSGEPAALVYLFFKPRVEKAEVQAEIAGVFEALQAEIHQIFASAPIRSFCGRHRIQLRAAAEYAAVMEPLRQGVNLVWLEGTIPPAPPW